jgi:hypothetical protein
MLRDSDSDALHLEGLHFRIQEAIGSSHAVATGGSTTGL